MHGEELLAAVRHHRCAGRGGDLDANAPLWRSEPASVTGLIDKVMSGEVRYCPHGRPVMMELTKYQLDKGFKRV